MQIPKIIHYCWFGNGEKPDIVLRCIESWKRNMPDYEIMEWNEHNYDINKADFIREAYEQKKWAFVSDYARFDILNEYGGIYVDTDVEFLKPLPKEMLSWCAFTGYESTGAVSPGLIFGAIPRFPITQELLTEYNKMHFESNGKNLYKTVNMVTTEVLERHEHLKRDQFQVVDSLALYPSAYFCGFDLDIMEYDIRPETISVHHYAGSWRSQSVKSKIQKWVKKRFGIQGYRRLLNIKRRLFGISGATQ